MPCNEMWLQLYTYNDCVGWIPRDDLFTPFGGVTMPGYYPHSDSKDARDIFGPHRITCEKCGHKYVDPAEGCIPCQFKAERDKKAAEQAERDCRNCTTCRGTKRMRWPSQSFYVPCPVCCPEEFKRCDSEWNGWRWSGDHWWKATVSRKEFGGEEHKYLTLRCNECQTPLPFERVCLHCNSLSNTMEDELKCRRNPERVCDCHGDYCPLATPPDGVYPIKSPFRVCLATGHAGVVLRRVSPERLRVKWDRGEIVDRDIKDLSEVDTHYKVTPEWLDQCQLMVLPHSPLDDMVKNPGYDEEGNRIGCGQCDNCLFGCECEYNLWVYVEKEVRYGKECRKLSREPFFNGRDCSHCKRSTLTHFTIQEVVSMNIGPIGASDFCDKCRLTVHERNTNVVVPQDCCKTLPAKPLVRPKKRIILPKKFKRKRDQKLPPEQEFGGDVLNVESYDDYHSFSRRLFSKFNGFLKGIE